MTDSAVPASFRDRVIRSLYWQAGGQLTGQVFSWVISIFIVRILSPADFGLVAMAGLLTTLLAMVAELGIGASAIQAEKLSRDQLRSMASVIYSMHGAAFVLSFLLAPLVALAFHEPGVTPVLRALSVTFLLISLYVLPESLLARELRFREKASAELAATVAAAITSLSIALAGGGVWALVGSMLMLHAAKAVLFNAAVRMPLVPRWSAETVRPYLQYGSVVMFAQIAYYAYANVDVAIGGRVLGKELLGLYVLTLTIASIPLDKILPAVTKVSFAAFARIQSEPERVIRNLLRGVRISSLMSFPFFFGLAVVAPDCIPLVLGDKWSGIILPLRILCLVFPFRAVAVILPPALFAIGRPGVNLGNVLVGLVIMTVAFLVGVRSGVVGLAIAWAIAYPVVFLITATRVLGILGVPVRDFARAVAPPAVAGALMGAAIALLRSSLPIPIIPLRLAVDVLAGGAIYAALLLPVRRHAFGDLRVLFGRGEQA